MAWLSLTTWATSDTPVLATVLNNLGLDIRTQGAAHDGGGYDDLNKGNVALATGKKLGIGITATAPLQTAGLGAPLSSANNVLALAILGDGGVGSNSGIAFNTGATGVNSWRGFWIGKTSQQFGIVRYDSAGSAGYTPDLWISSAGIISFTNAPQYANNAAAIAGGLTANQVYAVTGTNPRQLAIVF